MSCRTSRSVYIMLRKPEGPCKGQRKLLWSSCLDDLWWLIGIYSDSRWGHFKWEAWKAINRFIQKMQHPPTAHLTPYCRWLRPTFPTFLPLPPRNMVAMGMPRDMAKTPITNTKGPKYLGLQKSLRSPCWKDQDWFPPVVENLRLIDENSNGHIINDRSSKQKLGTSINDHINDHLHAINDMIFHDFPVPCFFTKGQRSTFNDAWKMTCSKGARVSCWALGSFAKLFHNLQGFLYIYIYIIYL